MAAHRPPRATRSPRPPAASPAVMAAVPLVLGVLAQQPPLPADDTGRTITIVIGALLGLALLLAVLTFWYWRRTDPRRRAQPAPGAAAGPARGAAPAGPPRAAAPRAAADPARPAPRSGAAQDRGISDEEWLRLTGGKQPPGSRRP